MVYDTYFNTISERKQKCKSCLWRKTRQYHKCARCKWNLNLRDRYVPYKEES